MDASKHHPARVRKAKAHRNNHPKPGPIGNTVGIIVPKTLAAPPGAPANPPVQAETQDEQGFCTWLMGCDLGANGLKKLAKAAHDKGLAHYLVGSLLGAADTPFAGKQANHTFLFLEKRDNYEKRNWH